MIVKTTAGASLICQEFFGNFGSHQGAKLLPLGKRYKKQVANWVRRCKVPGVFMVVENICLVALRCHVQSGISRSSKTTSSPLLTLKKFH